MKKSIIIYFLITVFNINAQHIYDQYKVRKNKIIFCINTQNNLNVYSTDIE